MNTKLLQAHAGLAVCLLALQRLHRSDCKAAELVGLFGSVLSVKPLHFPDVKQLGKSCNIGCHMKIYGDERCSSQGSKESWKEPLVQTCFQYSTSLLSLSVGPRLHGRKIEAIQSPMLDFLRSE